MKTIQYRFDQEIPIVKEADVVVVGSGPGGLGAAVTAARHGAKTLMVERYGSPGGMASHGEVHPFMANHCDGMPMDRPVYTELREKIISYLPSDLHAKCVDNEIMKRQISKDVAVLAFEDLMLEAGVELLYHHNLVDVITKDRKIECLVFASKSGYVGVKGKSYVDCTGDADLAARAGCEFELGNDEGHCQPMTTCFKLSHVDNTKMPESKEITRLYLEARENGEVECPRDNILKFNYYDEDQIVHFNTTRVIKKCGVNGVALSEAEMEARRQIRQLIVFFRKRVPGFENCRLHSLASHIGIRETRRIKGLAQITRDDFMKRAKFDDAILRCNYPIDIHSQTGGTTELVHMESHEYYEVPYGCIVPNDIDNLTIGGRPISVDVAIHASMRVMPPACSVGQAAGLAAVESINQGKKPADLDGVQIRAKLKEFGAFL